MFCRETRKWVFSSDSAAHVPRTYGLATAAARGGRALCMAMAVRGAEEDGLRNS